MDNDKLSRVFVDGGSIINILFLEAFDRMSLSRSALQPCAEPFHGIIPGTTSVPVGHITLPVTFGTKENFRTEQIRFEVVDFGTAYNAFLGRPALAKFMAIPHYIYLVLKMPGPQGVISVRGDIKQAYKCDQESRQQADKLQAAVELQKLKESMAELPPEPAMPEAKEKRSIEVEGTLTKKIQLDHADSSKTTHVGTNLDPK